MAAPLLQIPPLDGSLTVIPGFVDFHAQHNADFPWTKFPSRTHLGQADAITFAQFAQATHRVAHKVRPRRQGSDGEVVTLLIHCDTILYVATLAGLMRANIVPLPVSPKNSAEAVANLMKKSGSRRLIMTREFAPTANAVQQSLKSERYEIHVEPLFSLYDIFPHLATNEPNSRQESIPYPARHKSYDPDELALILHSSGSTGLPKPIPKTHKIVLQWARGGEIFVFMRTGAQWGGMALPSFHTMGIFTQLYGPLAGGVAVGVYAPQEPRPPIIPTPNNILETTRITGCDALMSVPSIIETWAQDPDTVKYLASLKMLIFAGGPLSTTNGNKLVEAGVRLHCTYGLTECGSPSKGYIVDESLPLDAPVRTKWDWEWIEINDSMKPRWVPQGDGSYELQLLTCETHQPSIENLPDTKGYATSDLWVPHPTKSGLWKIVGRADDVVVLGSGEKIVPIPQENHLVSSPFAIGAVMFGWGKPQPGVLIEPSAEYVVDPSKETELVEYRNLIWPVIEEANHLGPTFARLFKETIVVASPSKPLPRAAKGTVMRKQALALYAEEIEQLFHTLEDSSSSQGVSLPTTWKAEELESWLLEHARSLNSDKALLPDVDIFTVGFDSLSATVLRNRIIGALRSSEDTNAQRAAAQVSQNFVFDHPTICQLSDAISTLVDPSSISVAAKDPVDEIKRFLDKYANGLSRRNLPTPPISQTGAAVLLTGSTGNLGSHIVAALLSDERVSKVYTFDRSVSGTSPLQRLELAFEDRGLSSSLLSTSKLVSLTGDLNEASFGLDEATYDELQSSLTHIVHNAWKVNFNHSLASFEAQIVGTRKLIDLCLAAKHSPKLLFTSSVSVAHGLYPRSGPVPETVILDPSAAISSGYASSKYVVEQLIDMAAQYGLRGTSLRIGQVCGSKKTGAWNTSDWVPILVKSSIALGCLPDLSSNVDWIPMDTVAGAVLDIMVALESPSVVNVLHPRPVSGSKVFSTISDALGSQMPLVPYQDWLAKLEEAAQNPSPLQLEAVPAVQLLAFFRSVGKDQGVTLDFSTTEICRLSPSVRDLERLDEAYPRRWIEYWQGKHFLS